MVALALLLVLSVLPFMPVLAEGTATARYGKVTANKVYLRKQPSTSADYWFRMDMNHVGQILDEVTQNGHSWYKVETENPNSNGHTYTGYIMDDFFTPLTAEETANWLAGKGLGGATEPPPSSEATDVPNAGGDSSSGSNAPSGDTGSSSGGNVTGGNTTVTKLQGEVSAGGTNFRFEPSTRGQKIMSLERGTIVDITSVPEKVDTDHWYGVHYAGYNGYIMSTFIRLLSDSSGGVLGDVTIHGYVKLIKSSANLRSAPGGAVAVADGWKTPGEVLPYVSDPVVADGYTWYEIVYGGFRYWVRSDCVQKVDSTGTNVSTPQPTATTTPGPSTTQKGYVITILSGVNLRLQPSGEHIVQIKKGVVMPYEFIVPPNTANNSSKYSWYYVEYNGMHGYVRSDCVSETNMGGTATAAPSATATPTPDSSAGTSYGYVKMVKTGVNVRETPGGKSKEQLAIGTVVPVTGPTRNASSYTWYPIITAKGTVGYVRGDCVVPCDASGNTGSSGGDTVTNNPGTTAAPTATPAPADGVYGYVQITKDKTFIRATMGGTILFRVEQKGGIYPMWGPIDHKNNYKWYPVIVNGSKGWVREDCVVEVDQSGATAAPATPSPTPAPTENTQLTNYVITILDKVNLRVAASKDSSHKANVPLGTVMAYNTTTGSGSSLWYRVIYDNQELWVLGTCVKIMTQSEYDAWLQQNPGVTPPTSVVKGYVKTIADKVNIRDAANGSHTGKQVLVSGTVLPYSETQTVRGIIWYYIQTSDGFRGWINGDYVIETDNSGTPVATPTPTSAPTSTPGGGYVPPTAGQEASYTTLKYGSTGTAVKNLVTELKVQGYYTGAITSTYTREVEAAVKAFQQAKGLKVDGVAGSETQHALFQTVPVGSGSNVDFTFYPAEKIDWFTGGIQQQWPKGANVKIYDVKTGIVWTAHRWSGGNHVDAEPLTAADTARLCQIYGVKTAKEIADKNLYEARPSLALVGTHNYACSLYGIPHSDYDTTPNNNFDGVLCIHFTNSAGHDNGGQVSTRHQQAIEYAYTHAPGGQK